MTWDNDRDWIPVIRHAHRAKGARLAHDSGDVGVCARLAVRNRQQRSPAGNLKIRAAEIKAKTELAALAREVLLQFQGVGAQEFGALSDSTMLFPANAVRAGPPLPRLSFVKLQRSQTFFGCCKKKSSHRGLHGCAMECFHMVEMVRAKNDNTIRPFRRAKPELTQFVFSTTLSP